MKRPILILLGTLAAAYCLFPFYWTVVTALKPPERVFSLPLTYFPWPLSLENFYRVWVKRPFGRYVLNSLLVAGGGTLLCLFLGSLAAFRLRYLPVERALSLQWWLLAGAILPPTLLVIPIFMAVRALGLVNHLLGVALSYALLNLPFAVWMLYAAFSRVPRELDEAALLDGLSRLGILFRIILPLSRTGLAVCAVLTFIFCWNEFLIALTLLPDQSRYTVPVGIAMLSGTSAYEIPWGEINAAVALTTLPVILLTALFQRWILEGLTAGAVKG
ncbi:carbohydrate ABC transporter permease [Thermosulfurimonas marina]|uniref:Carbohydrate ABC transporter permease n=1 Tax=Thermosulfurimonas marina TaxID=2047767 RepID=A0A6H1WTL7_9BACT|nr:carbohydrate ABC transporter permease [Thermosulfurimonas marina]QJA06528.1 carbohydrate ABC transporter permease [Thermosulfurimonas marina]